jgi:probable HAF family extracellular repeat protein
VERLRDSRVCERLYLGNRPVKIALAIVASTLVALLAPSFARAGNTYTVQDLGVVSGDLASEGFAINDAGWTVGNSEPSIGYQKAFLNNGLAMIGLVDPYSTEPLSDAYGINSSGAVVGDLELSVKAGGARNGFLYNGGSWTDLGALVSKGYSYAYAINNHNLVVGTAEADSRTGLYHAVSWDASGRIRDLGTLPGDVSASALGVNNLGQVVGSSSPSASSGGTEHAFYYDGTSMNNIGTLGGASAEAVALNDYSHVVGTAQNASGQWDAFLYENGSMQDLGVGEATAVNSYDQVVGDDVADTVGGYGYALDVGHPFLYEDGHRFNLNGLIPANSGWELKTARGINNSGQIVGAGIHNGEYHAYRLDLTLLAKWAPELRYDSRES